MQLLSPQLHATFQCATASPRILYMWILSHQWIARNNVVVQGSLYEVAQTRNLEFQLSLNTSQLLCKSCNDGRTLLPYF